MRFPPFSVLLRGTLRYFSQLFTEKFWWFPKLSLSLQACRIVGNAEERPMNVTHRQRHEVGRFPNGKSHLFFCPPGTLRFRPLSNQKSCSYEKTTANTFLTIRERSPFRGLSCRSEQRKKTSVMT